MSKNKSLSYQIEKELYDQRRFGESRHHAKEDEGTHSPKGIFSFSTAKKYEERCVLFGRWVKEQHPDCRKLEDAKAYVKEYLEAQIDRGLSAYTVHLDASALAKLYHCKTQDFGVKLPPRERKNITRSRGVKPHDRHFSEAKNKDVVDFCRGTGLRRVELSRLKVSDVAADGSQVYVRRGKGGKDRWVTVLPKYQSHVAKCAAEAKGEHVFEKADLKNRMDIHSYRREYATALYKLLARDLSTLGREKKYYCRKDKAGIVYDRRAMRKVSNALGHRRIAVIAGHYID